jgi:RNAse (barnase) inhibitor barstar
MKNILNFVVVERYTYPKKAFLGFFPENSIRDTSKLFENLAKILDFPDYFGQNWDALLDCLSDFDWIEDKQIILVHQHLPNLDDDELRCYLEVLSDAVSRWEERGMRDKLLILFDEVCREKIEQLMV